ncbi:MAG: ATP-dependent DNA ligase [Candidatus Pacearchaeota archaeon]|jgi:DNA ligase-1|nr:DNA ligase [Candidatus Pacearchaeota archaeon]MDP7520651.1 ATP-dependent DNA ligase [Candidatus Pacearchaeota archaeon]|tara:strand:- start:12221 stop:13915 length:1695 start_codon:yes stop_codon:yes gene_type:complete
MRYQKLAELYEKLSSTTKRLEKIEILSSFLKELPEEDKDVLYLLLGDIYPEYDEKKIGISNQLAIKAISKATGIPNAKIIQEWKFSGDLGEVSKKLTKNKKQVTLQSHVLTINKVLENLRKLPDLVGKGTIGKKLSLITELLTSATPLEALYLIRTLIGDLRIGLKESTIRESISSAFFNKDKEASKIIQEAIDKTNDISAVFEIAKEGGLKELKKIPLVVGKPIKVMLAQKVSSIKEGFKALGENVGIEYKYDGFRLIIHKKEKEIKLFTRRLENVTLQFPEVVEYIREYVKGDSFILDTEAVGFDKETKEYKPFQEISQRIKRKYNIEKLQKKLPIEIQVFDIIYYNGKSQLKEPFKKRTTLIKKIVKNHPKKIVYAKQIITNNEKKAEEFYKKSLEDNQEGIMMKNLDAVYQPGSRVGHMLKIKPEERDFDLVITGAEYGTGKRSGWLSSFILSCRDKDKFLEIGKVGTGITEKVGSGKVTFEELTRKIKPLTIKEKDRQVTIKPKIVVTITYQEIQKSQNYSSGFALRFPRFTTLRPDRNTKDITTLSEVKIDYGKQKRN